MFRSFGLLEIGLILVVVAMVLGRGKLPQVGGAIGEGMRAFRRAMSNPNGVPAMKAAREPGEKTQGKS